MHGALADADLLGGSVTPSDVWTNDYLDTDSQYIGSYADVVTT
jgi:NitT/TauT family transport system substrate-binding protein